MSINNNENLKTINGFSYSQASEIIKLYLNENFEAFRNAIKEQGSKAIQILVDRLDIQREDRKKMFSDFVKKNTIIIIQNRS